MQAAPFDIAIIGGGINGCGIARDAAGRGLSVYLCEKSDLAGATSSASTKLIHGGLRYLEYYEFRLVRESLMEREVLWRAAPHIIWPLRFVLPHHKGLRPAWLIRLGLFLYDHLGGRRDLPPCKRVDLTVDPAGEPLKPEFRKGFEYSDCWADDFAPCRPYRNGCRRARRGRRNAHRDDEGRARRRALADDRRRRVQRRDFGKSPPGQSSTRPARGWRRSCRSVSGRVSMRPSVW